MSTRPKPPLGHAPLAVKLLVLLALACNARVPSSTAPYVDGQPRSIFSGATQRKTDRPRSSIVLEPIAFDAGHETLPGEVEICLTPSLRQRQWNVETRPYRIDLGSRTWENVQRMATSIFDDTRVTFDERCGRAGARAWLDVRIRSANRDLGTAAREQTTTITLETRFVDRSDRVRWTKRTVGRTSAPPAPAPSTAGDTPEAAALSARRARAARDFGQAMESALRTLHAEILAAPEIRAALSNTTSE